MTDYQIRERITGCDRRIEDLFYDTFYTPEGMEPLPRELISLSYYQEWICGLGSREGDLCFEAFDPYSKEIVGAVWTRLPADSEAPFLMISVAAPYRGQGIGSALLRRVFSELKRKGYKKVVLSVDPRNRAVSLYKRFGFTISGNDHEMDRMVKRLRPANDT